MASYTAKLNLNSKVLDFIPFGGPAARSGGRYELACGDGSRSVEARAGSELGARAARSRAEALAVASQARLVELSLQVSGDLQAADLDRLRMSQALGNILGNAIPCTEAGGNTLSGRIGKTAGHRLYPLPMIESTSQSFPTFSAASIAPTVPQPWLGRHRPGSGHHPGHSRRAWGHHCSCKRCS